MLSLKKSPDTYGSNAAHAQARSGRYDSYVKYWIINLLDNAEINASVAIQGPGILTSVARRKSRILTLRLENAICM